MIMKQIYIFMACLMVSTTVNAQNDINFNASSTAGTTAPPGWLGYMNVSNKPADGGAYQFGSSWGVADLIAQVDTGANTVTLKPNRIGDTAPYWQTTGVLEGNKIMDASFYIQDDGLAGTAFSFNANVNSNTLNSTGLSVPFTYSAFIKVFAADYSSVTAYTNPISSTGNFTISLDASQSTVGQHIQYGFQVIGVNINSNASFDAAYNDLGSIVIGANTTLSVDQFEASNFNVFPNPTVDKWTVSSNTNIRTITVFDVLGKQVLMIQPNSQRVQISATNLNSGLYIAKIESDSGTKTMKLIKN